MMRGMQTAMMIQMNAQPRKISGRINSQCPPATFEHLEDSIKPDLPFEQAIQGVDSELALLNRGIGSPSAGATRVPLPERGLHFLNDGYIL